MRGAPAPEQATADGAIGAGDGMLGATAPRRPQPAQAPDAAPAAQRLRRSGLSAAGSALGPEPVRARRWGRRGGFMAAGFAAEAALPRPLGGFLTRAFLAAFCAGRFLAATFIRLFFRAGGAFFAFLPFLAFFAFARFAMIDLPIVRLPTDRAPDQSAGGAIATDFLLSYGRTAKSDRIRWPPQSPRHRTAGRPVDQLDRMDHRDIGARRDLGDAADIAGGDHIGSNLRNIRDLAIA